MQDETIECETMNLPTFLAEAIVLQDDMHSHDSGFGVSGAWLEDDVSVNVEDINIEHMWQEYEVFDLKDLYPVINIEEDPGSNTPLLESAQSDEKDTEGKQYLCECGKQCTYSLHPNKLHPNTLHPNKLHPNTLHPNTKVQRYQCKVCGKTFASSRYLDVHTRRHNGDTPYKCNMCDKAFLFPSFLRAHQLVHNRVKKYKCDMCLKAFSQARYLNAHKRTHTEYTPYKCNTCDKAFTSPGELGKHQVVHTVYKCDVCDITFSESRNRNAHIKRIHIKDAPYKCNMCNKAFITSNELGKHHVLHTTEKKYKCDMCDKAFALPRYLKAHIKRLHTVDTPYNCNACNGAFINLGILCSYHMLQTAEKKYKCDMCNKTFAQSKYLEVHKRTHFARQSTSTSERLG